MNPSCPLLASTYHDLLALKNSFRAELKEAAKSGDFSALDTLKKETESKRAIIEENLTQVSLDRARELFKENFLGPEAIEATFGFKPETKDIPKIPFSKQELQEAAQRGEMLVVNWDKTEEGEPLTIEAMAKAALTQLPDGNVIEKNPDGTPKRYLLYKNQFENDGSIKNDAWFKNDQNMLSATPERGWQLVSPDIIPDSTSKNYLDQTQLLTDHIRATFPGNAFPQGSKEEQAEKEWNERRPNIQKLIDTNNWEEASQQLSKLEITKLFREPIGNTVFRYLVAYKNGKQLFTDGKYSWSDTVASDGRLAVFGNAVAAGADVIRLRPGNAFDHLGVVSSRR